MKHQVPLLKVHFNLKRSKYYGNIVHIGLHMGSRSSSAFCDFIYYNITQNVQKTQLYLLTTTLPLHTDTYLSYLQKYPNFVSKSHLKPRTTKSQKNCTKKAGNKYSGRKSDYRALIGRIPSHMPEKYSPGFFIPWEFVNNFKHQKSVNSLFSDMVCFKSGTFREK